MPEPTTEAKPNETAAGAGQQITEGNAEGAATEAANTQAAKPNLTPEQKDAVTAEVKRIIAKERKDERAAVEKEQRETKAKEQGEFESLYKEIEPKFKAQGEELESYKSVVTDLAKSELAALEKIDKDITAAAPPLDNPRAVLAWLPIGKKLAEKLNQDVKPGMGRDPRPTGSLSAVDKARKAEQDRQKDAAPQGSLKERWFRKAS